MEVWIFKVTGPDRLTTLLIYLLGSNWNLSIGEFSEQVRDDSHRGRIFSTCKELLNGSWVDAVCRRRTEALYRAGIRAF